MKQKGTAGRMKVVFVFLLLFGPAFILVLISTRSCEHKFLELDDYGSAPHYKLITAQGDTLTQATFKDKIVLIFNIQSTCPEDCAISFWHLDQMIYQHIRKNKKKLGHVKLISFVVDETGRPLEDLSEVQKMLQDKVEAFDPDIWHLVKGDNTSLFDFEHNNQELLQSGDEYFGGNSMNELMLLIDKENHLRMVINGKTEGMVRRMRDYLALLQKQYDKAAYKKSHKN